MWWRRRRALRGLESDLRDHIERQTHENVARGMSAEEARRQAFLTFGNVELAREDTSTIWMWLWCQQLKQDILHSLRGLRRTPGFVFVVVLTLALGIGANAGIFSAVDAVVFGEVPVADPDSLVEVYTSSGNPYGDTSYLDYFDLRDSGAFIGLAAVKNVSMTLDACGQAEALAAQLLWHRVFHSDAHWRRRATSRRSCLESRLPIRSPSWARHCCSEASPQPRATSRRAARPTSG